MTGLRGVVALAVAAVAGAGCWSTAYTPSGPGVHTVMHNGQVYYMRDGRRIKPGLLGGGLLEAVQGNPRAEAAAREHIRKTKNGFLLAAGGLVCSTASVAMAFKDADGNGDNISEGWLITSAGCLVVSYVGLFVAVGGVTDKMDAINLFNDDVATFTPDLPPGVDTRPHQRGGPPGH